MNLNSFPIMITIVRHILEFENYNKSHKSKGRSLEYSAGLITVK